jgi:stage V sporulation protein AC
MTNATYEAMVQAASPKTKTLSNCVRAFAVGGMICAGAEGAILLVMRTGMERQAATTWVAVGLILLAALLTAAGLYAKLGSWAGAGSIVPITGFANSVAAPAIEHKKEGLVLGVGAKMFIVAGPVILFGTLASVLVGIIYFFVR